MEYKVMLLSIFNNLRHILVLGLILKDVCRNKLYFNVAVDIHLFLK